jgi:PAS domain S-box-containing protein
MSTSVDLPVGGGVMGHKIRHADWSETSLGPRAAWPLTLKTALGLLLNSPEPMYLVWGADQLFFCNDAYRALFAAIADTGLGQPMSSVWGAVWSELSGWVEKALQGEGSRVERHPVRLLREGVMTPTFWTFSLSPIHGESGHVDGIVCQVKETTQEILTLKRLDDNEAFTDRVLASINDCIKVLDLDGRLTFMSEGGQRIMEVSDFNAIKGCPWPDFWQDEGHHEAKAAVQQALAGGHASFMGSARTLAGNLKWWHVQVSPILGRDGKPEKLLSVSRDMTQLRDAEDALREINEALERDVIERTKDRDRIWRLSADLMLVARFDGTISAVNPAWGPVLGLNEEELLGEGLLSLVHPDDIAETARAIADLSKGHSVPSFKNRFRHTDGHYKLISWTAVPDEEFIHAVGRDMQSEEEANAALRASEEALRQSQKLEAIGQLTGGVAHDFNNLLTVIKSCADLLRTSSLPDARRSKYVAAISDTVDRAAKLTNQLLAFARRQSLKPEVFDVGKSVARVGEMLDALTGSRIQVDIDAPMDACFINADESQFDTAIVNLVVNARDAMNGVGNLAIKVSRTSSIPSVRAHAQRKGDFVVVAITDSGSGISPEDLGRIFEPFYTTKGIGKGTGLGLSQVFGFAKQSGGEVLVQSTLGSGSSFSIYLPETQRHEQVAEHDDEAARALGHGLCVLVVEDHEEIGRFTEQTLKDFGYEVLWVSNAEEALGVLATNPANFHVVFSDISMPGMSGIALYGTIEKLYPWLPVVLTTGYSQEFADLSQTTAGQFDLLQKPYSIDALSRLLQKVATRHLQ